MFRARTLTLGALAGLAVLALALPLWSQVPAAGEQPAYLLIRVPAGAVLTVDDSPTQQSGPVRRFMSPPLTTGKTFSYTLKITWTEGGEQKTKSQVVQVKPGEEIQVDLRPAVASVEKPPVKPVEKPKPPVEKPFRPEVPYVPTPQEIVDKMLELADLKKDDVVYDLGCGDGRIVVTAAKKYGCKAVGVDIDPARVKDSLDNVKKAGVENLVTIRQGDATKTDVSAATVVTLYLLPELNAKIAPNLKKQLKPGARIISHDFDVADWRPDKTVEVTDKEGLNRTLMRFNIADPDKPKLTVPYVPTPQDVVEKMLELADVKRDDVVYDLGCGDGRIVVTAAKKFGCKALGVDLDPERIKDSQQNIKDAGVEKLVTVRQSDVLKTDVSPATVVTLYLLPDVNLKLKPILQKQLRPGARVVSHDFDMGDDWQPLKKVDFTDKNGGEHTLYLWKLAAEEPKEEKKEEAKKEPDKEPDVIFVPTPQAVVDKMLELAEVKKDDIVYDLGCGDGRIPVTAAKKYGVKAWGFDVDPQRIKESTENVEKNGVQKLVTIKKQDIFTLDLSKVNVVTLYLLPDLNVKLMPQLEKMKPGSRIVSHDFAMRGAKPKKMVTLRAKDDNGNEREHTIYLWTIPLEKENND